MTRKIGLAVVALLASSVASLAADLPRSTAVAPVHVPIYNWTGLYVGVNAGYGWGRQDPINLLSNRFDRADFDISGGMIGGTIGAQIQQGYIVLGLEADLDWASIKGDGVTIPTIAGAPLPLAMNMSTKIDALATARARVGVAMDNWLLYATGGVAFVNSKVDGNAFVGVPCGTVGVITTCSDGKLRPGMAAGLGAEWGFTPNWSAKAEYLYIATAGSGASTDHLNVVRAGVNYRFGRN
jgi:outer membrane immunogenic protein